MSHRFLLLLALGAAPGLRAQTDLAFVNDFNGNGGFNRVCQNDDTGTFTCDFLPDNVDRRRNHGVATADLDGDGDDDVAIAVLAGTGLSSFNRVCLNDGPGTFACEDLAVDLNSGGVAAADLDGDGDADLVFANRGSSGEGALNTVCFNDGSAAFTCEAASPDADESRGVAAADLDGDGDADLVFATSGPGLSGDQNRVCLNDGAGSFTCEDVAPDADASQRVAVADLDGDGDPDLVFANFPGRDRVCLNDGAAAFTCSDVSTDGGDTYDVAAADLDGDGDADLAFANPISNNQSRTNTVCFNDGSAAFTCEAVSPDTDHSRGVVAADVDGDGDGDLVFANERFYTFGAGTGIERLCRNDGSGAFACEDLSTSDDDTYDVAVGNFSGTAVTSEEPPPAPGALVVSAFPNPAADRLTVSFALAAPAEARVAVYDVLGREVAAAAGGLLGAGRQSVALDVAGLPAGVYVVRLAAGPERALARVTVVR